MARTVPPCSTTYRTPLPVPSGVRNTGDVEPLRERLDTIRETVPGRQSVRGPDCAVGDLGDHDRQDDDADDRREGGPFTAQRIHASIG